MGNSLLRFSRRRNFTPRSQAVLGKNKPLKRVCVRWCSQVPLTENQLRRKREEFWDTAPVFEGRLEIWNALKLVAEFVEKNDYGMAQAILDGADILLPTGSLCDCYDRLGTRYQLPLYVFSEPANLIRSVSDIQAISVNEPSVTSTCSNKRTTFSNPSNATNGVSTGCWPLMGCYRLRGSTMPNRWMLFTKAQIASRSNNPSELCEEENPRPLITPYRLRVRLSTGKDHVLELPSELSTIMHAKRLLAEQSSWPVHTQRWFLCGRPLSSHSRIRDCEIPDGFLVQVFVYAPPESLPQQSHVTTVNSIPVDDSQVEPIELTPSFLEDVL